MFLDSRLDIQLQLLRWKACARRILRTKNGIQGSWTGDYETAEEALAVLQKEYDEQ